MNDAADHAPINDARLAARVGRQMRLDLRKLRVRQPELIPIHLRFLSEAVNHKRLLMPTLLWVPDPKENCMCPGSSLRGGGARHMT